jgi:hypothetical protein
MKKRTQKLRSIRKKGNFTVKLSGIKPAMMSLPTINTIPDPELRTRKKVGLVILNEFDFKGGQWEDGTIYDPKSW